MKKPLKPYYVQRCSVLRSVAALIESAFMNGDDWLYEDPKTREPYDEATIRCREKAVRAIIADLRRKAG